MSTIVATNLRLPEELLKALKYKAIEEKTSVNQLIRDAVELSLAAPIRSKSRTKDPFENIIGIAKSGIKDGSTKHDHYLYGRKK